MYGLQVGFRYSRPDRVGNTPDTLQGDLTGCRTGNGGKLSSTQAEPGQAINSAVA